MKDNFIKADQFESLTADQKFKLAEQLGTTKGFYQYYFDTLPKFTTFTACFNNVNDLYFKIWKQYKFSGMPSWKVALI